MSRPALHLDNQLCFPLYALSRQITRLYQPLLSALGLTYPQYIVMMILWQQGASSVSAIGDRAMLNTNTLTPLLKRLEQQGLIERKRSADDERVVMIAPTAKGEALEQDCACIPEAMLAEVGMAEAELRTFKQQLDTILDKLR